MDPDRLAAYETAFLALDAAAEAEEAGDWQRSKVLRNQALTIMQHVIHGPPPTWRRTNVSPDSKMRPNEE
jgi:hypothetical protein